MGPGSSFTVSGENVPAGLLNLRSGDRPRLKVLCVAQAAVGPGEYWNEVWITLDEFPYTIYTWPTAVVKAMGVFESRATDGKSEAFSEMWIGTDSVIVKRWTIVR
jgi:hypothetical protein